MKWISVKDRLPEIPPGQHAVSVLAVVYDPCYEEMCPGMDQLWSDWSEWYLERFYLGMAMSAHVVHEIEAIKMLEKTL